MDYHLQAGIPNFGFARYALRLEYHDYKLRNLLRGRAASATLLLGRQWLTPLRQTGREPPLWRSTAIHLPREAAPGGEWGLMLDRTPYELKPLYIAEGNGFLRFASQVKALEAGGAISCEVDSAGVVGFLLWGWVPEPWTIRRSVRALPAGTFLHVERGRIGVPRSHRFLARRGKGPCGGARGE